MIPMTARIATITPPAMVPALLVLSMEAVIAVVAEGVAVLMVPVGKEETKSSDSYPIPVSWKYYFFTHIMYKCTSEWRVCTAMKQKAKGCIGCRTPLPDDPYQTCVHAWSISWVSCALVSQEHMLSSYSCWSTSKLNVMSPLQIPRVTRLEGVPLYCQAKTLLGRGNMLYIKWQVSS